LVLGLVCLIFKPQVLIRLEAQKLRRKGNQSCAKPISTYLIKLARLGGYLARAGSVASFHIRRRGPNAVVLRRSGSLLFECFAEGSDALGKRGDSDAECTFDNARLTANIAREVESRGLSFA